MSKTIVLLLLLLLVGCIPPPPPTPPSSPAPQENIVSGPDADLQKAMILENEKKYSDAIAAYGKIAVDSPQSPAAADALFAIAYIHVLYDNPQKDYAQALSEFEDFVKRYPDHEKARDAKNWQTVLKLLLDTKKENTRLHKSIEELEKVDIRHEEKQRR